MALRKALASGFARGAGLTGRQPAAMLPACAGAAQTSHKLEDLCPGSVAPFGVRHSLQQVKMRMRSVGNTKKITAAMKMVAASKMRVSEVVSQRSRGMVEPFVKILGDNPDVDAPSNIIVPVTSDKGLCGGINSNVVKYIKQVTNVVNSEGEAKETKIAMLGEKARPQIIRYDPGNIVYSAAELTKIRPTFAMASMVCEDILKQEADVVRIVYNRFVTAISYKPTVATILSAEYLEKELEAGGLMDQYEVEGPDRGELLMDLSEFHMAATMYNAIAENSSSENASRMAAMESSTKNASEMLEKLTLLYNRSRQAAITNELIEIISGASALDG
mmetsp:Transcript_14652/g.37633  ORF Transcript_14652/g.37633 Transcript_14652/m.37633 type:complete len:332 (+) Transcript_14652:95-1090(+)